MLDDQAKAKKAARELVRSADPLQHIILKPNGFYVFLDETGQVDFSDRSLFGLAGVCGYGRQLKRAAISWRQMKVALFGSHDARLHASGPKMTAEQLLGVSRYFVSSRLRRFALILYSPPLLFEGLTALHMMQGLLTERLVELLDALPRPPSEIIVFFEQSERLLPLLITMFPGLQVTYEGHQALTVQPVITPKTAGDPFLEMADQIAHRAQRQVRLGLPAEEQLAEFAAVFPKVALPHVSLMLMKLSKVEYQGIGVAVELGDSGYRISMTGGHGAREEQHGDQIRLLPPLKEPPDG